MGVILVSYKILLFEKGVYNMIDVREVIKRKISNFSKKGFLIDIDDYELVISKHGFVPPSDDIMIDAIEKYCRKNHHDLKFIRLSDPIIFMLDGKEAYEAYPELIRTGRFSNGYVVHCIEYK